MSINLQTPSGLTQLIRDNITNCGSGLLSYNYIIKPGETFTIKFHKNGSTIITLNADSLNVRSSYLYYAIPNEIPYGDPIGPDRIGTNGVIVSSASTINITNNALTDTHMGLSPLIGGDSITVNDICLPNSEGQNYLLQQRIRGVVSAEKDLIIKNRNPDEMPFSYEIEMLLRQKPTTETWLPYYAKLACFGVSGHNTNVYDIIAVSYTHAFSVSNNTDGDLVVHSIPVLGVGVAYDFEFCITPKIRCENLTVSGHQLATNQNE